jgi:hypothetical protein
LNFAPAQQPIPMPPAIRRAVSAHYASESFYVYSTFNGDENSFFGKHFAVNGKNVRRNFFS